MNLLTGASLLALAKSIYYKLVDTLEFTGESFGPLVPLCMAVQKSDLRPNNTVQEKYKLAKYFICLYPRDILKTFERMC